MLIGSSLQPVVAILDADFNVVREFGTNGGREQVMFAHRFEKAGMYYVRVADYQHSGRAGHFYRIIAGEFPLVTGAFPLGVRKGASGEVALRGFHVPAKVKVGRQAAPDSEDTVTLRPEHAFNQVRVALGDEPEIDSQGGAITVPVTINGRIAAAGAENRYRFQARKGEQLVLEVNARRLGSDLDSVRRSARRRTAIRSSAPSCGRCGRPTITLRDHDSAGRGIRIAAWDSLQAGRLRDDRRRDPARRIAAALARCRYRLRRLRRAAAAYFDTTAEAHAIDSAVYKVQIHPPGTKLSPNGLPVAHLYYRNDDGGPGYGRDSAAPLHRARRWRIHRPDPRCRRAWRRQLCVPVDGAPPAAGFPADGRAAESERPGGRRGPGDGHGVRHGRIRRRDRCRACRPARRAVHATGGSHQARSRSRPRSP